MTANLAQLLVDRATTRPELAVGVLDDQLGLREALGLAAGGADALAARGLTGDDRVALVATSSTGYLISWMSCLLAGVPVALINPTYPPALLARMLDDLDPAVLIAEGDAGDVAAGRPVLDVAGFRVRPPGDPWRARGLDVDRYTTASFMHTSGTTGVPKFCAQSHEYFLRLGRAIAGALRLAPTDRMLAPLPLFHINPLGYGIVGALTAGADALAARKFSARAFWPEVREHGITALALHAPPVEILKRATTAEDAAGHRVRTMFYADGEFLRRFGIAAGVSGYGSTEAAGVSHLRRWSAGDDIPADASRHGGPARTDIEWRISDSGEIHVRERELGALFTGYLAGGRLDPTRDDDGWFATGDLGRLDAQGGLVFLERAAESIRVKGEFVPIPYVEDQLGAIGELEDLALWKRPGDLVDDDIVLYVVADPVPLDRITAAIQGLPAFMRPCVVAQVKEIPRDAAAGKVQRRRLPEQEVRGWLPLP